MSIFRPACPLPAVLLTASLVDLQTRTMSHVPSRRRNGAAAAAGGASTADQGAKDGERRARRAAAAGISGRRGHHADRRTGKPAPYCLCLTCTIRFRP